ncbi:hypothetical protein AFR_42320 [Actinoplanes friuliensis DSM 7358]|uniref:Uncharacterized protein n=1 Tax=Actinoplanes friuliensis DSM 7358 TaxID=1246995 RepID=U5WBZ5_9ACTN|nr:hypothetical protein AFR_42320 [Actinoplanes friuliensis DSM 7358]
MAGEAPEISGAVHRTNSPFESQDWINDAARFHRAWLYTGRIRIVEVDINRADPTANRCAEMRETESKLRPLGHIVVPLQGVADGGIAIVDRVKKGADGPAVRTYACSGNAIVSVSMLVEGVIGGEADLTARSAELTAVLTEVLADLRPR